MSLLLCHAQIDGLPFCKEHGISFAASTLLFGFFFGLNGLGIRLAAKFDGAAGGRVVGGAIGASCRKFFLVDLIDHRFKGLGDVGASAGTRLEVLHVVIGGELLSLSLGHGSLLS